MPPCLYKPRRAASGRGRCGGRVGGEPHPHAARGRRAVPSAGAAGGTGGGGVRRYYLRPGPQSFPRRAAVFARTAIGKNWCHWEMPPPAQLHLVAAGGAFSLCFSAYWQTAISGGFCDWVVIGGCLLADHADTFPRWGRGRRADRRRGWPTGSGWGTGWPSGPSGGPTVAGAGRPFAEGGRGCRRGGFPTFFPTLFPTLFPTRRPLPSLSRPRSAPSKPFPLPNFSNVFFQLDSWKKLENRGGIGRKTGFDREAGITKKPRFSGAKGMGWTTGFEPATT